MKKLFQKIWYYICHPTNGCDSCGKQVEDRYLVEEFTEGGFMVCDSCLRRYFKNKNNKMNIQILSTDKLFTDSPDAGTKECICSRCLKQITEEESPAIRVWPKVSDGELNVCPTEYRFHINCLSGK